MLPGLINSHHHFYQTLTRAWAPVVNAPLFCWLQNLYRLKYGSEAVIVERTRGWATRGSARAVGRDDLGQLAPGKQADVASFTLDELRFFRQP